MRFLNTIINLVSILCLLPITACGGGGGGSSSAPGQMMISSFAVAPSWIKPGTSATLTAVFSNGAGTVDQGIGTIQSGVPVNLGPLSTTTTYTLSVSNASKTISTTAKVTVSEFTITGSLKTGRSGHTATLLSNGKVLVAGGFNNGMVPEAELYDPITAAFNPAGALSEARFGHTATRLANGKVLLAGGYRTDVTYLASAELYDPATGMFTLTGRLGTGRTRHTATLLADGTVLIIGGQVPSGQTGETELYDPTTGLFHPTGGMFYSRIGHTATLLPNSGRVIVIGGYNNFLNNAVGISEIYNPDAKTWGFSQQPMIKPRWDHTSTLLDDGTILVTCGHISPNTNRQFEIYTPATDSFASPGSMAYERYSQAATLLRSGKVLISGGWNSGFQPIENFPGELFDPATRQFNQNNTSMNFPRTNHTATLLATGRVLIIGGLSGGLPINSAELF